MEVSRFILNRRAIAATRQTERSRAQRAQSRRFPTPVHHRGAAEALTREVAAHSHALATSLCVLETMLVESSLVGVRWARSLAAPGRR